MSIETITNISNIEEVIASLDADQLKIAQVVAHLLMTQGGVKTKRIIKSGPRKKTGYQFYVGFQKEVYMATNKDVEPSIKAIAKQLWARESLDTKQAWKAWADADMQEKDHPPMIEIPSDFDPMPTTCSSQSGSDTEMADKSTTKPSRKPQGDSEDPDLIGTRESKWKTVKQIQQELVERDLEKSGKKEVIVKRLQDAIRREQTGDIPDDNDSADSESDDEDSLEEDED